MDWIDGLIDLELKYAREQNIFIVDSLMDE